MSDADQSTPAEVASGVPFDSPLGKAFSSTLQSWLSLHSNVPRRLYHYTRLAGLEGILSSKSIWASHAEYLNDASELIYGSSLIEEVVKEEADRSERLRIQESLHRNPDIALALILGERPFVACFCENGDLLSQWRGYGAGGPAYALGFDLSHQVAFRALPSGTVLRRVIYDRGQQQTLVHDAIQSWLSAIDVEVKAGRDEDDIYPYPALWVLQRMLVEMHLCFKNPAFAEEREWRLIKLVDVREEVRYATDQLRSQQLRAQMARVREQAREVGIEVPDFHHLDEGPWRRAEGLEVKFRPAGFGLVPYIEIPLVERAGVFTDRLPLWEVVHGPSAHPELALSSLVLYLDAQGYGFPMTEVKASGIPLRGT